MTLYNHLDTRTENVRHDPTIGHRQALSTLCDHKGDELLLIIPYNRTLLHNTSYAHRLRCAGGTVPEFAHRHIVDSVRLCISVHEVDYRCQNSQSAKYKTARQPSARSRRNFLFIWYCQSRLHTTTPL